MDQAVHDMPILNEARNTVEILVHISESLDDVQRNQLVDAIEDIVGVDSAEFCPLRYHLMLIRYDRDRYSSLDILSAVSDHKLQARLIGPI